MPELRVPDRFKAGITRIGSLGEEEFGQLLAALKRAPSCKNSRELLAWIADETPAMTEKDRKEIISSIIPMIRVQRNSEVSVDDFASDVWDSLSESTSSLDGDLFKSRTSQLIAESALDLASSRIDDVKVEVERNFCKIRVMTDLRPAFRKNAEDLPTEMAVIHNFQFGYHDGMGKHQEFYVSLDADDLAILKKAILEAEKRAHTLERLLEKSGVSLHK